MDKLIGKMAKKGAEIVEHQGGSMKLKLKVKPKPMGGFGSAKKMERREKHERY